MKHSFLLFLSCLPVLIISFTPATAQVSFDERYTLSKGFTALMDFSQGPAFLNHDSTRFMTGSGFSLLTYTINPRINLFEFSEQAAISIETPLSLALHISPLGIGSVNVPVILAYNYGAVATHYSSLSKGFSAGIGMEYTQIGLLRFPVEEGVSPRYAWFQPTMVMGYRYRGRRQKAKELNVKVGYGQPDRLPLKVTNDLQQTIGNRMVASPTVSVKVSFVRYINY
jgi:hypothetical protein